MQPRRPNPSPSDDRKGKEAEQRYMVCKLNEAKKRGLILEYARPDFVALDPAGNAFMGEFKCQDAFEAPPFDGHGLPLSQVQRYVQFDEAANRNLRTLLFVHDRNGGRNYYGWLDDLESGESFTTKGSIKTPRRIYPLTAYRSESTLIRIAVAA